MKYFITNILITIFISLITFKSYEIRKKYINYKRKKNRSWKYYD